MRHDHKLVKLMHRHMPDSWMPFYLGLPFLLIENTDEQNKALADRMIDEIIGRDGGYASEEIDLALPFLQFILFSPGTKSHSDAGLAYIMEYNQGERTWRGRMMADEPGTGEEKRGPFAAAIDFMIKDVQVLEGEGGKIKYEMQVSGSTRVFANKETIYSEDLDVEDEDYKERIYNMVRSLLIRIVAMFRYADERHLVEVRGKPNKRDARVPLEKAKKPWTRNDLPHYIYLDAPMKEAVMQDRSLSDAEREKVLRRGGPRRAHWRRLTHERFRHHPMFGKRVRVRATWVGSREWTVGDTIYTLRDDLQSIPGVPHDTNE